MYSYEPDHFLAQFSHYSTIISTRLHGAIAGLSAGVPSILLAEENNFRLRSTQKPFNDFLPIHSVREAFGLVAETSAEQSRQKAMTLRSFRTSAFNDLKGRVKAFLAEFMPEGSA